MKARRYLGLLAAACALAACTDMGDPVTTPPPDNGNGNPAPAQRHVVFMRDPFFDPESLTVAPGDTVVWMNAGVVPHTSTSGTVCGPTGDGKWNSGNVSPGESFARVFQAAGDFPYYCIPHCDLGMTGNVTVSP